MAYRAVLFDVGGPLDMELAREMAVDSAIATACGLEGIRVGQATVEEASDAALAAFAPDVYAHMIETLCGGEPLAVARVRRRVHAMVGDLDVFQLRPDIDLLLRRLRRCDLKLGVIADKGEAALDRLARVGIRHLFDHLAHSDTAAGGAPVRGALERACDALGVAPAEAIMVGDRLDNDIAPARKLGMAAIQFRVGRHRRQRPRSSAEEPDAVVTDVRELEGAIATLLGRR